MSRRAVLLSTGAHHPPHLVPNAVFDEQFGAGVDEWLAANLDIHQRYWADDDTATSDLVVEAARQALDRAGVAPADVDLLIVATDTPDQLSPSTASVVAHRLGLSAGTFDVNAACSAFVIGLDMAAKYIAADPRYRRVLVCGGYLMSKHLNKDDKKTVTLFADGAGAVLLGAEEASDRGLLGGRLHTEPQYWDWMGIYGGGTRRPVTPEVLEERGHQLVFAKKFPKEINPVTWERLVREQCAELGITPLDIDHYVFTQLNIHSIRQTLEALGVPVERGHTVMQKVAYTGSACIPMAFDDLVTTRGVKPGELVAFVASGGGLSFATAVLRV